ncbi:MAG: 5-formyltetrahydrofolate cyclo-ligase [Nitrososphaeria archaeon]|nr:5-formyltetrahydrofolate cyclo-ligase [Nitrososphaeria archaeon]
MNKLASKDEIRKLIWKKMMELNLSKFPPPFGRIPNFIGAEDAAKRLFTTNLWRNAKTVKVNPDSPQAPVRQQALEDGKTLIMPTPRIRHGFLVLEPKFISREKYAFASTIKGAFVFGKEVNVVDLPKIELVVVGSVAVNIFGERIGKGEGYSEIEWALVREEGKVVDNTPVVTTVHDVQVVEERFETKDYDLPVDWIITPSKIIKTSPILDKPKQIYWNMLTEKKIKEIPILYEKWKRRYRINS